MLTCKEHEASRLPSYQTEGWDLPGCYGHLRPGLSRTGLSEAGLADVLKKEGSLEPYGLTDDSSLLDRAKYALRTCHRPVTLQELNIMMAVQKDGLPRDWARVNTFYSDIADLKPHFPDPCLDVDIQEGRTVMHFWNPDSAKDVMWDNRCNKEATNQYMALMCLEYMRLAIAENFHQEALQQLRRLERRSASPSLLQKARDKTNRLFSKPRAEPENKQLVPIKTIRDSVKTLAERFPFFDYAMNCWGEHLCRSAGHVQPVVLERLMAHANVVLGSRTMAFTIMCYRMEHERRVLEEHNFTLTEPHGTPETMLKLACLFGAKAIVQQVLAQGKIRVLPIHLNYAIYSGKRDLVQLLNKDLLGRGLRQTDESLMTPPWLLAKALDRVHIIADLERLGYSTASMDARGRTAFRYTAELLSLTNFKVRITYGQFAPAELDLPDKDGVTPSAYAASHGRPDIEAVILKAISDRQ